MCAVSSDFTRGLWLDGVTDSCELPSMGAGDQAGIFCKSHKSPWLLYHLSSLWNRNFNEERFIKDFITEHILFYFLSFHIYIKSQGGLSAAKI